MTWRALSSWRGDHFPKTWRPLFQYCDVVRIFELCPPELDAVEGGGEDGARVQARHRAGHVVRHAGSGHGNANRIAFG